MISINTKIFFGFAVVIVLLLAAIFIMKKKLDENKDDLSAFKQAMSSKFDTLRNKMGQQTASVPASVFADISSLKATVAELNAQGANIQSKIDRNTQSLVLLDRTIGTTIKGSTKITGFDTVRARAIAGKPDTIKAYPTYAIDTATKWYSLKGTVGPKQYAITPVFNDSIELKSEFVSHGLFKKSELTGFALSKNPFANTSGFKSLVLQKQPAPVLKYILVVLGAAGGFYLGQHIH
jgi:hypothetical protein